MGQPSIPSAPIRTYGTILTSQATRAIASFSGGESLARMGHSRAQPCRPCTYTRCVLGRQGWMHQYLHHGRRFRRGAAAGPCPDHRSGLLGVDHATQRDSGRRLRSPLHGRSAEQKMGGAVGEKIEAVEMRDYGTLVEMKYGIGGCARHRLMEFGDGRKAGCVRLLPRLTEGAATTGTFHHQSPDLRHPFRPAR